MTKLLVAMALDMEAQDQFDGLDVLFTGVGKVNASVALSKAIAANRPDHVINLGTAGSQHFDTGALVNCTRFIQRDMDVTPLGVPIYETPFDAQEGATFNYGYRLFDYEDGVCGTGDNFATTPRDAPYNVMDMEAYALAKTCAAHQLAFTCVKYITDGADTDAAKDWKDALVDAAKALRQAHDDVQSFVLSKELK